MSDSLRSNDGCWTCRVRRKKCDETNPACSTCTSLQLPCYGYGPKPVWMDRGVKEREVAKNLRAIVKQTLSLQRIRLSQQPKSTSRIVDQSGLEPSSRRSSSWDASDAQDADFVLLPSSSSVQILDSQDEHDTGQPPTHTNPAAGAIEAPPRKEAIEVILTNDSWSVPPVQFEEDQASLLMHFYDHVLPRLFPFYNPSVAEGGRGWLLSILTQTKPLYQVALSLAAYHQQSVLLQGSVAGCSETLSELQERHVECIRALRSHMDKFPPGIQANSCEQNIEVMACITLLLVLEVSPARPML